MLSSLCSESWTSARELFPQVSFPVFAGDLRAAVLQRSVRSGPHPGPTERIRVLDREGREQGPGLQDAGRQGIRNRPGSDSHQGAGQTSEV